MCGIVGFISNETEADEKEKYSFFEKAIILDTIRGRDSTGIFCAPKVQDKNLYGGTPFWAKIVAEGHEFVKTDNWKQAFSQGTAPYKYVVGHNRSATKGGVSIKTAHPFQEPPITLVHNGTLVSTYNLEKSQAQANALNDSHTICINLAIAKDPIKVLELLDGAFTLVWHDARDDSLNMARNTQRPLHLAKARKKDTLYFCSEGEMLYWINDRVKIGLENIVSLKSGKWLKFLPGKSVMDPEVHTFEPYVYKASCLWKSNNTYHQQNSSAARSHVVNMFPTTGRRSVEEVKRQENEELAKNGRIRVSQGSLVLNGYKLIVNGKVRDISSSLENDLLDVDMLPEELYAFIPCTARPITNIHGQTFVVDGYIEKNYQKSYNAQLHGVSELAWNSHHDKVWSFRPKGVFWLSEKEPMIIGEYISMLAPSGIIRYVTDRQSLYSPVSIMPSGAKNGNSVSLVEGEQEELFPGPAGSEINKKMFLKLTEDGCFECHAAITTDDAEFVEWISAGQGVLCPTCVQRLAGFCDDSDDLDDGIDALHLN